MSLSSKPLTFRTRQDELRRKRRMETNGEEGRIKPLLARLRSYVFPVCLFAFMTAAIVTVCFLGRSAAGIYVSPNQIASMRVVAQEDFTYPSAIQKLRQQQQIQSLVPTVIVTTPKPLEDFQKRFDDLSKAIDLFQTEIEKIPGSPDRQSAAQILAQNIRQNNGLDVGASDLLTLTQDLTPTLRHSLFAEGLKVVERIETDGVYEPQKFAVGDHAGQSFLFSTQLNAKSRDATVRTDTDALRALRRDLPDGPSEAANVALFSLFRQGITPNLEPDLVETRKREEAAMGNVPDVMVHVRKGQTIIEEGDLVSDEDLEKLQAYQQFLNARADTDGVFDTLITQYILITIVLLLCAAIYLRVAMPNVSAPHNKMLLMSAALLLTLAFGRIFVQLDATKFFIEHPAMQGTFSLLIPSVFGALLVSVLIGTRPAVLVGLMSALFCAMMTGYSLRIFVGSFLVSLITIYMTRGIHQRARIIRAALFSGLAVAALALVFGLNEGRDIYLLLLKMLASVFTCVLAGIIALALYPVFEYIFKITTDIRLLELTDFNHPLLRRLQIDAPGTYHHCLMVANLAERAAADVGANPIACRVGALFHDIGKIDRPEYFTENQRNGVNPHNADMTPPMSALIIKSHVKEGAEIARQAKLPQVVLDAITQHHGTTLMQYFFDKAKRQHTEGDPNSLPLDTVDEATYRYDGPRPQTKESAVIQLADSVEAASRSLKKVTPQSVEELINQIFRGKILDGQLDECPITVQELSKIKESFALTLLTMLHGRVAYNAAPAVKPA